MGNLREKILHSKPLGEFLVLAGFLSFLGLFTYLGFRVSQGIYSYNPGEYQFFAALMVLSFAMFVSGAEILLIRWQDQH